MKKLLVLLGLMIWVVSCSQPTPTATPSVSVQSPATTGPLPPTFTPPPTAVPPPTQTPHATPTTAVTATSIDFDKTAVELRYAIPALGLDRRFRGNISGQIFFTDEITGQTDQFNNQADALVELQQLLPQLSLEPVPDDCGECVQLTFDLPISEESGTGWLQDTALLVSLDVFMTAALEPHFPPGTQIGLRRSISPYAPAHTLAFMEDGRLWRWLATDDQIAEPVDADIDLLALLNALSLEDLEPEYIVGCEGGLPIETLFLGNENRSIDISCPEFSLPSTLLPLYMALDDLLIPTIADAAVPRPLSAFPLSALLDYRRADNAHLTIFQDGQVTAIDVTGTYTSTLSSAQVISLTTSLLNSGQLQLGLTTFDPTATPQIATTVESEQVAASRLLVRGSDGVYDGRWIGIPELEALNTLLDSLLPTLEVIPTPAETAVPTVTSTPTPTE